MKTLITLLFALVAVTFGGTAIAAGLGTDPIATTGAIVAAGMLIPKTNGILMSSVSVTDIVTALGGYYRKNSKELITKMLLPENLDKRFEVMDGIKDEQPLPNLSVTDLVKPANDTTFQPTANALGFGARILKVRKWKVDLLIVPAALEKTWLGGFYTKGSKAYQIPFEQFIMNYIVAKVQENLRMQSIYRGVYNAAGATPIDVMDGMLKLVADEIIAGNIVPTITGAITSTNVIDKLELVHDDLGEAYKSVPTIMKVNPTIFDWYGRRYRSLHGPNANYEGMTQDELRLDGTNCTVVREAGLGASQRVICTQKENMVYGTDSRNDANNIEAQRFERTIKILIDGRSGVQFKEANTEAIAVSDQA